MLRLDRVLERSVLLWRWELMLSSFCKKVKDTKNYVGLGCSVQCKEK